MAKKTVAFFGILMALAFALTFVSAANSENNFTISVSGNGESSSNPVTGDYQDNVSFTVNFENLNSSSPVNISWNGTGISSGYLNNTGNNSFSPKIEISDNDGNSHSQTLNVYITDESGISLADLTLDVYYRTNVDDETACYFDLNVDEDGDLKINDFDISSTGNGDEEEWQYMDSVEVEVELKNTGDDDVEDVEVKIIILNSDGEDVTDDFDFDDDVLTGIGKLKDGEKESVIFKIKEVPTDVEAGKYKMYIVAYSDGEEDNQCVSKYNSKDFEDDMYYEFSVESVDYEDSIVVKMSDLGVSMDAYCGVDNFEISIPVVNLNDEDEDMILINLYNSELGINEYKTIEDLNDGDTEEVSFFISLPDYLEKSSYDLQIYVYFDWDDDEDEYETTSYDESNKDALRLNLVGCKDVAPTMKPTLASETTEGVELVVSTIVTNNGNDNDFDFSVSGYESWAELVSITPESVSLDNGDSQEVIITLMPTESGTHSFKISSTVDGNVYNQPVTVNVKGSSSITGFAISGVSGITFYLVAGILGLLLLIFFILLIKVLKKPRH